MNLLEKLLDYYHITQEDYLELTKEVNLDNFNDGHELDNVNDAVKLVNAAIDKKEKIVIYGDYDADGIMSTAIIKKCFDYLSYPVGYYVPCRYIDGYGITYSRAKEFVNKGYKLVICVDNGVSAYEAINYLKDNNVKVLVIDHHSLPETLPNIDVLLHPVYSHLGETATSAGFISFMFTRSLLNRSDKYLATLASISLISDMMPLVSYNRNLSRAVYQNYKKGEFLALDGLFESEDEFNETAIGLALAPKINSLGRMLEDTSINKIIPYLTSDNRDTILTYLPTIIDINESRKEIQKNARNIDSISKEDKAIVIKVNEKEGIIGLIAQALMGQYHVPVIVFTLDSTGEFYKGSCRSPSDAFNVVDVFNKLSKYLGCFGGHALAGGCSLKKDCFDEFAKEIKEIALATDIVPKEKESILISLTDVNKESFELVRSLAPFGECWKAPRLAIKHTLTKNLTFSKDNKHILTVIGTNSKITGFNFSKEMVSQYRFVDLFGNIRKSSYRGYISYDFFVKDISES